MNDTTSKPARMVAIFGSASVVPGSDDWEHAELLGRRLAEEGYVVLSGGYSGVMEACSRGACEAGGHVVGGTVGLFEARGLRPNGWVREVVAFDTLRDRLFFLVQKPDAIVALRGGVGTLSEIALVWSLLQVGELPARPFVLVGPMWRHFIEVFMQDAAASPGDLRWLTLVDTVDQVVPALQAWWAAPPDVPLRLGDARYGT